MRTAVTSTLEAASHLPFTIQSNLFAPAPFRAELRTILMGAGRLGYVSLPKSASDRQNHAVQVLGMEARCLGQATKYVDQITQLPGMRWTPDEVAELRRKVATMSTTGLPGDRSLIRTATELVGIDVAAADPSIDATALRDHLTWIWHTSSGSAHGFAWQSLTAGDFITDLGAVLSSFHVTLNATKSIWTVPTTTGWSV